MAEYPIGSVVQFVRSVTRTNPDRVINVDEKGHVVDISSEGAYSVQPFADETPVAGILEADIQPSIEQPGDSVPGYNQEPDMTTTNDAQDTEQG